MEHTTSNSGHSGAGEQGGGKPEVGRQFFRWIRSTGLTRADDGWAGGLFAALAARLGWDTALVRGLGVVVFILFFSPAALFYGLGWILVPDARGQIHLQQAVRGNYTSGLFGGGALAIIGGLNVFTPISLAGPFAVLLNLAIIAAVVWAVWALVRQHRANRADGDDGGGTDADGGARSGEPSGKGRAGSASSPRTDGKPAWYPKETVDADADASGAAPTAGTGAAGAEGAAVDGERAAAGRTDPETTDGSGRSVRAETQKKDAGCGRRGLMTLGMLLLAAPLLLAVVWLADQFGIALITGLLLGLAGIVVLLAVRHIIGAARGKKGRGGMLAVATVLMMVLFAGQSGAGAGTGPSANHIFGNYTTQEESVNSAFSNTTVDLRHLTAETSRAAGPGDDGPAATTSHSTQLNSAFSRTIVVVPDETRVEIDNGLALGRLNAHMQQGSVSSAGVAGSDATAGPAQAHNEIELDLNAAFGSVEIYDATTYAAEVEQEEEPR